MEKIKKEDLRWKFGFFCFCFVWENPFWIIREKPTFLKEDAIAL